MRNPWIDISLEDYESHMAHDEVMQLQALNAIMSEQFRDYPLNTLMISGVAGGNGLEHVNLGVTETLYGVDINRAYLADCEARHSAINNILKTICIDVESNVDVLPNADRVIANLFVEYLGIEVFCNVIEKVNTKHVSCVLQNIHEGNSVTSNSQVL